MNKTRRGSKPPGKKLSAKQMALSLARAALDMNALEIAILKVSKLVYYTDYLVIAGARSTKQAQSIAENVQRAVASSGEKVIGVEGDRDGNWILVDSGDVIVHVFYQPVREFYDLEKLWGDAQRLELPETEKKV